MNLSSLVIPVLLAGVAVCGMGRRVDVYGALTHGAEEGLAVLLRVIPALVGLLTAVSMFRASGAMEWLSGLCAPVLEWLGIRRGQHRPCGLRECDFVDDRQTAWRQGRSVQQICNPHIPPSIQPERDRGVSQVSWIRAHQI